MPPPAAGHPLLICDDEVLTYGGAEARSAALAKGLLAYGAGKGTRVGLLYPNGADFVVALLAAARIGAIAVPLSTFSTAAELRGLLRGADIEILLATDAYRRRDYVAALREAVPGLDLAAEPPLRCSFQRCAAPCAGRRLRCSPARSLQAGQAISDAVLAAVRGRQSAPLTGS